LAICPSFGTGIGDRVDLFTCPNQVLSRLVDYKKMQKIVFLAKNCSK
jgi:hypothetical protein